MVCPVDGRYGADLFRQAMESMDLWEATFCAYGAPLGELVVGTILYSAIGLNIFIRTGSLIIPFVLSLILGGTILAQMFAIINTFVGIIVLLSAPIILTGLVYTFDGQA